MSRSQPRLLSRLAWFAALWALGAGAIALAAFLIRALLAL